MRLMISLLMAGFLVACGDKEAEDTAAEEITEETEAEESAEEEGEDSGAEGEE